MSLTPSLAQYFTSRTRDRGAKIARDGLVSVIEGNDADVVAKVRGTLLYDVELIREGSRIGAFCTCPYFDTEGECKHIWATLLVAEQGGYLLSNELRPPTVLFVKNGFDEEEDALLEDEDEDSFTLPPPPPTPTLQARRPDWYRIVQEIPSFGAKASLSSWPLNREVYYLLMGSIKLDENVGIRIGVRDRLKSGRWGRLKTDELLTESLASIPDPLDREILLSLAGPHRPYYFSKTDFRSKVELLPGQPEVLLPKMCQTGRCVLQNSLSDEPKLDEPLQWDGGGEWKFRLAPIREGEYWRFSGYFHRGEERLELQDLRFASADGVLATSSRVARVETTAGLHWLGAVWPRSKLLVPIRDIDDFLREFSRAQRAPEIEWPQGFELEELREAPQLRLTLREAQGPPKKNAPYRAALQFDYRDFTVPQSVEFHCHYNKTARRLTWRDYKTEAAAAQRLIALGATPYDKRSAVSYGWEIPRSRLTHLLSELPNEGWRLEAEGKAFRRAAHFEADLSTGIDWFDLNGAMDFEGQLVGLPALLAALARNERTVILPDGSIGLIPEDFIEKYGMLSGLGTVEGNALRFQRSQASLLDALLAAQPEVRADQAFADYRARIGRFEGITAAEQPEGFTGALRDYQREGLAWLRFLEEFSMGGCLADDMGVGKTAQVLALLETRRELRQKTASNGSRPGPSLVVAPRSVIFNWKQEAARFTPKLQILDYTHAERRSSFNEIGSHDVVLATYGTLRRDIMELRKIRFDYAILDEAQAIKNVASDSAKAARLLTASHRLALSGTPVENHLGELGSLFEFLNPGMLGSTSAGRLAGRNLKNADEGTRMLLGRALRPFILRRTKGQVARELPTKTEQTLYCEMPHEQRKLYNELRDHYRRALLGRIDAAGIGSARMHILEALLRLRQAACHPGLIDDQRREGSSAKLEALMPKLREVIEGGHKLLVFSQFTSFLSIVRDHLGAEDIPYAYLDGQTTDRQACVERFQNDADCPAFLISLKAGGVGLNLTAAEYVFLLDPWWNPAVEAQAIDRTHRIGQTNQVFAYRLIARDTVEEKVMQLQERKRRLADEILTAENSSLSSLGRDDLEILLS
jgi:superfamily II DNA or RNA helicase